jgi:hypothetical protein
MKLWHVLAVLAVAGGIFGFFTVGHAANKTAQTIASNALAIPNQAATTAAEANVQQALGALSSYFAEHGTYAGATAATLASYNQSVSPTLVVGGATSTGFCVEDTVDGATASATSTSGPVTAGACP